MAARWCVAAVLIGALAGCELVDEALGLTGSCTRYNAPLDQFWLAIDESDVLMPEGSTAELTLTTTWLDSQLRRVPVHCTPTWTVSDDDVVVVLDRGSLSARGVGVAVVTATVTGTGGVKRDSVVVGVIPTVTEVEPNNGPPAANVMADGEVLVGISDYADDEDWFAGDLGPGASGQFTLRPSIEREAWRWSYWYSGTVWDAADWYVAGANRTFTNTSDAPARYNLRVTGSGTVPYTVRFDVVAEP
jgi:hypothetical protein